MTTTKVLYEKQFTKAFSKTFLFPTPVGFPVIVQLYFGFGANAKVIFGVKGTSVEIGAGTGLFINAGAKGAFGIPLIIEIGVSASIESSLNANAILATGFDK